MGNVSPRPVPRHYKPCGKITIMLMAYVLVTANPLKMRKQKKIQYYTHEKEGSSSFPLSIALFT
jgi:hypothetical protein